jgi:hypothetical protein
MAVSHTNKAQCLTRPTFTLSGNTVSCRISQRCREPFAALARATLAEQLRLDSPTSAASTLRQAQSHIPSQASKAMADNVEAQIAAEQANRRKKDKSSQRTDDKSSLSVKSANFDSDIYGSGSRGYDTSIAVGGGDMDEDLDDSDRPVRLVDSCKQAMFTSFVHMLTLTNLEITIMLCTLSVSPSHSHRPEAPPP